ncbi:MAG: acyltransferase [Bacteroidales bacterium]|jgi:acetyltransferase-like isoleucine patch superfamily enzyme|nr:acyltransferase [Bacteroidales bacterium]
MITPRNSLKSIIKLLDLRENPFHPLVFINGKPKIGKNVYIGLFSEINAKESIIQIGNNCDIASFVSINVADSHLKCIGKTDKVDRKKIILGRNVFVGSHSFIAGETIIGHHSVVGAGTILINAGKIPPFSLIVGNPAIIKPRYFKDFK